MWSNRLNNHKNKTQHKIIKENKKKSKYQKFKNKQNKKNN
jgi:hypothetical protein